jgi:hypothetical protein
MQDAIDVVQEDPLQGYLVNRFIESPDVSSIFCPVVSSIVTEHSQHLLRPLPQDGPAIDDVLLDDLYHEHMVSRVSMILLNRKEIERSDYVWFHLDTGATCTFSHCLPRRITLPDAYDNQMRHRGRRSFTCGRITRLPNWRF